MASGLQDMTVGMETPIKMSMWEGLASTAVIMGPAIPGDVVVMTVDHQIKVDNELSEPVTVPMWGCVGRVLHHTRGRRGPGVVDPAKENAGGSTRAMKHKNGAILIFMMPYL